TVRGRSPGFRLYRFRPPSQDVIRPSGLSDDRLPVTVAGAAAVSNRVPLNPFGNLTPSQTLLMKACAVNLGGVVRMACPNTLYSQNFLKPAAPKKLFSLRKVSLKKHFAAYQNPAKLRKKRGEDRVRV